MPGCFEQYSIKAAHLIHKTKLKTAKNFGLKNFGTKNVFTCPQRISNRKLLTSRTKAAA